MIQEFAEATSSLAAAAIGGAFGTSKLPSKASSEEDEEDVRSSQRPDMLQRVMDLLTTDK